MYAKPLEPTQRASGLFVREVLKSTKRFDQGPAKIPMIGIFRGKESPNLKPGPRHDSGSMNYWVLYTILCTTIRAKRR